MLRTEMKDRAYRAVAAIGIVITALHPVIVVRRKTPALDPASCRALPVVSAGMAISSTGGETTPQHGCRRPRSRRVIQQSNWLDQTRVVVLDASTRTQQREPTVVSGPVAAFRADADHELQGVCE